MTPEQAQMLLDKIDALILDFRLLRHEVLNMRARIAQLESEPPEAGE